MNKLFTKSHSLWVERAIILGICDFLLTLISFFVALWVRHDMRFSTIPAEFLLTYTRTAPLWGAIVVAVLYWFRLYHSIWSLVSV